jgi:hypothetical protein
VSGTIIARAMVHIRNPGGMTAAFWTVMQDPDAPGDAEFEEQVAVDEVRDEELVARVVEVKSEEMESKEAVSPELVVEAVLDLMERCQQLSCKWLRVGETYCGSDEDGVSGGAPSRVIEVRVVLWPRSLVVGMISTSLVTVVVEPGGWVVEVEVIVTTCAIAP